MPFLQEQDPQPAQLRKRYASLPMTLVLGREPLLGSTLAKFLL